MSNHTYIYVAYNVEKIGDQQLDNMEDIEVLEVDLNQIPTLITKGEIDHSWVFSAFYLLDPNFRNNMYMPSENPETCKDKLLYFSPSEKHFSYFTEA
ncbi:MAG: hypothetical protein Ct9H300mP3_08780 [Gammaproteobacteria bacterium]|nr:MAG: hypothetical protein Ct9H300mP3_08780 [Gammaproteobacteria bacterium]